MNKKYVNINQEFIVKLRKKLKLTQQEFANLVGVSHRTITNWEKGITTPIDSVKKLLTLINNNPKRSLKVLNKYNFVEESTIVSKLKIKDYLDNNPILF